MTPTRPTDPAARLRPIFIGATSLLVLLLAVFAYALAKSQDQQRTDIEKRFSDRAEVAASVNESIFQLSADQGRALDSARFGAPEVDEAALKVRVEQNQSPYALIVDQSGKVLASAGKVASGTGRDALVARAIKSKRTEYSDVVPIGGGKAILEAATSFPTQSGTRVDVSGVDANLLGQFLGGFLVKLPNVAEAKSYVVDRMGRIIAQPGAKTRAGTPLPDKDLNEAIKDDRHGAYGDDRYFASDGIDGTPWRIVLAASQKNLYSTVETTVPWLIFGAFVVMSALGLLLVRRVLLANAQLERADISRQHALEINDNVVQRLVLAKYALDRGATETSREKLSETLKETQQLVTSLLEEKEIGPGALRREEPAGTEGPPEPPAPQWQRNQ